MSEAGNTSWDTAPHDIVADLEKARQHVLDNVGIDEDQCPQCGTTVTAQAVQITELGDGRYVTRCCYVCKAVWSVKQ